MQELNAKAETERAVAEEKMATRRIRKAVRTGLHGRGDWKPLAALSGTSQGPRHPWICRAAARLVGS